MKLSHSALILFSGLVWFAVGCYLLPLGLMLVTNSSGTPEIIYPLISTLSPYLGGGEQVGLFLIALALGVGYLKSKYVLSKTVRRSVGRIQSFPNPTHIGNVYGKSYLILLAVMIGLGISIKAFGVADDVRGAIDIAVGAALINGAVLYFRMARRTQTVARA